MQQNSKLLFCCLVIIYIISCNNQIQDNIKEYIELSGKIKNAKIQTIQPLEEYKFPNYIFIKYDTDSLGLKAIKDNKTLVQFGDTLREARQLDLKSAFEKKVFWDLTKPNYYASKNINWWTEVKHLNGNFYGSYYSEKERHIVPKSKTNEAKIIYYINNMTIYIMIEEFMK